MAGIKDIMKGRRDEYELLFTDIKVKAGWNCRFEDFNPDDPEDAELAREIAHEGVRQPLTIYRDETDGDFYLEDGHRRLGAVKHNVEKGLMPPDTTVYVRMSALGKGTTDADRLWSQKTLNNSKQLSPLEFGILFTKAREAGQLDKEIAERAGVSRAYVGQLIMVVTSHPGIVKLIREGAVALTLAVSTLQACDGDAKKALAQLKKAVAEAKKAGKDKATAKHMKAATGGDEDGDGEGSEGGSTRKKREKVDKVVQLREAFQAAFTDHYSDEHEGLVVRFDPERFATFAALIGVNFDGVEDESSDEEADAVGEADEDGDASDEGDEEAEDDLI